jgi:hypothetical protein
MHRFRGNRYGWPFALSRVTKALRLVAMLVVATLASISVAGGGAADAHADPTSTLTPQTEMQIGPGAYDDDWNWTISSLAPTVFLAAQDTEEPAGGYVEYDFQVQYALNDADRSIIADERVAGQDNGPGYSYAYTASDHDVLPGSGNYSWRMRALARNSSETGEWSDWQDFKAVRPPAAPAAVTPSDGAVVKAGDKLVVAIPNWSSGDEGYVTFIAERNWEYGNPTRVFTTDVPVGSDGRAALAMPEQRIEGDYRWSAILSQGNLQSARSDYRTFTYASLPRAAGSPVLNQTPGKVTVRWPGDYSSAFLVSSTVTLTPGNYSATVDGRGPYEHEFSSVPPGHYVATTHGTSILGDGPSTSAEFDITATAPVAVRDLAVDTPSAGNAKVSWSAPETDGGAEVTHYRVTVNSWDAPNFETTSYETTDTSYELTGLDPGYWFIVDVAAVNAEGTSESTSSWFTVFGIPKAPTNITVRPGDGFAYINWDDAENNGSPITEYRLRNTVNGDTTVVRAVDGPQGATIDGLDNDVSYEFTVSAVNAAGESPEEHSPSVTPKSQATDTDSDGLPDIVELKTGSNPDLPDSDSDGLSDKEEVLQLAGLTNPALADSDDNGVLDPEDDSDSDGLTNRREIDDGSNPAAADSDADGLTDSDELSIGTSNSQPDTDGDGLNDFFETKLSSDPLVADSDNDGVEDGNSEANLTLHADELSSGTEHQVGVEASVQAIGTSAQLFHLSAAWTTPVPGMVSPVASLTTNAPPLETGPATQGAIGANAAPTSTITFSRFSSPVTEALDKLAPVTYNEMTGTWELSDSDVSVSTADETVTITSAVTGLRYALVDLGRWRANATQCAAAESGNAPLNVQVILDDTSSMDEVDPTGERFTALRTVLSTLSDEDRVSMQIPNVITDDTGLAYTYPMGWRNDHAGVILTPREALADVDALEEEFHPVPSSEYWFGPLTDDDLWPQLVERYNGLLGEVMLGTEPDERQSDAVGPNPYVPDAPSFECREDVTLLVTDGKMVPDLDPGAPDDDGRWAGYDEGYVPFVERNNPVHVLDVGDGDESWLAHLAVQTGGTYSYVPTSTDLAAWTSAPTPIPDIGNTDTDQDSDSDGLTDYVETHGITNVMGQDGNRLRYFTDPNNPDTDSDGISDGEEAGRSATTEELGSASKSGTPNTAYYVVSDPQSDDGDHDDLSDTAELEKGSLALDSDFDVDGVDDGQEEVEGTLWDRYDSDNDGFADGYEIDHDSDGYDPLSYDPPVDPLEWLHDFSIGLFCGDFEICRLNSIPWLLGSVASGLLVYGDVRDTIIDFAHGEPVSALLALVGIIPAVGDAAGTILRVGKFATRLADDQRAVAAALRIVEQATGVTGDVLAVARKISPETVKGLEDLGVSPTNIAKMFQKNPLKRLKHILNDGDLSIVDDYARRGVDAPGTFHDGKSGEQYLLKYLGREGYRQKGIDVPRVGPHQASKRFPDCIIRDGARVTYYESKVGNTYGRAMSVWPEIARDKALLARPGEPDRIEWHFFANDKGAIAMSDPVLEALREAGIKIFIHLPS